LNIKEKAIAHIANAITVFSMQQNTNQLSKNISMVDFILKTVPEDIKQDVYQGRNITLIQNTPYYLVEASVDSNQIKEDNFLSI